MGKKKVEVQADSIRVCVRFRPQNSVEKRNGGKIAIQVSPDGSVARILHPKQNLDFVFDRVFNIDSTQPKVYEYSVSHMIDNVMNGFNCTVFAYGQTGSGKTYSMEGSLGSPNRGIVPRLVESLFEAIEEADEVYEFVVKVSYVEIYLERLRDLLRPSNGGMKIRESKHGVYIQGVTEMYVREGQEVINLMQLGARNRTVNSTNMNAVSSRSHGVFLIKLIIKDTNTGSTKMSKLMMVDLAGSEKVRKTGATGALLEEAKKINQSLSCLGSVMNALSEGQPFVPYRDSVLTRLLSDSLGGNCKTTLIICASPSNWNMDESISTLRFGTRAKKVKNKAKINAEKTAAEYKRELAAAHAKIRNLQRLCTCLKRDLKMACEGKLTDPGEGTGARFEKGEGVDLGSDEEDMPEVKKKKHDPWATPAGPKKKKAASNDEEELVMLESDDDDVTSTTTADNSNSDAPGDKEEEMDMLGAADQVLEKQTKDRKRSESSGKRRKRESVTVKSEEIEEIVSANDKLTEKVTELRQKVTEMRTELMMKSESLIKEKEKTEDAEVQFEKIQAQSRSYMDEAMTLKYERERLVRERDDLKAELENMTQDLQNFKTRTQQLETTQDSLVEEIRDEERAKVDEFIMQARQAIADRVPASGSSGGVIANAVGRFAGPSSAMTPDQELRQTKLDKIKLEQTLQQKVQEYVQMKLKAFESMDKVKKLEAAVQRKEQRLRGQHNELVGLGALKKEADAYHFEASQKLEKELSKVKKENATLKTQVQNMRTKQKHMTKNADYERDEASAGVKKKLKSMVMPIRGGGKKKKRKKKGRKKTVQNAQDLMPTPAHYNNYHAKSPSMMNAGFMQPQAMLYQPQFDQDNVLDDNIPEIPMMGGPGMMQNSGVQYFAPAPGYPNQFDQNPHGRNNTFVTATNFWGPSEF